MNKSILGIIKNFNLFKEIYVEGENGIIGINSGELIDLEKNSLNINLFYDSKETMGTVYLGIKNKEEAKKFLSELIEKIGYKDCLIKIKRKI